MAGAAGYRAIAPDWIGAGYSDHPPHAVSLTANTMQPAPAVPTFSLRTQPAPLQQRCFHILAIKPLM